MNKLIEDLIKKAWGISWIAAGDALTWADETYLNDRRDEHELERQYENLDLTKEQRKLINDYIACTLSSSQRYADISYMCGIKDTVSILVSLGPIKCVEADE